MILHFSLLKVVQNDAINFRASLTPSAPLDRRGFLLNTFDGLLAIELSSAILQSSCSTSATFFSSFSSSLDMNRQ